VCIRDLNKITRIGDLKSIFATTPEVVIDRNRYSVFHQFMQAEFAYDGSSLILSQFLPLKTKLTIKVVKIDFEKIISLP
jgi:hypothetical protein